MVDRTERLTLAVTVVFGVTLVATAVVGHPLVWVLWAVAMVVLTGGTLVAVNRADRRDE
ncbi:hypothetical protein [Halopiger goleimassiliensis]|uniref:hypothetical protein n=1 Tax=Halopiger goleimassiliensis TaxID=1293048 RepID=UPI000AC50B08|nr:hypothetical protein [Halopiger goleimassiliensis]